MAVLIHALGAAMGGAIRHLGNFLPQLGPADPAREYIVLVRESLVLDPTTPNVVVERVPDARAMRWTTRLFGDCIDLPRRIRREKLEAVVSLTNFGPIWSPVPHVLFQRNAIYYSAHYYARVRRRERIDAALRRRVAIQSMLRANLIVTPSDAMTRLIQTSCPSTRSLPFRTLYHGFTRETLEDPLDPAIAARLEDKRGLRLLYPTHPAPYKGFDVLFEALAHLKAAGLDFSLFTTISLQDGAEEVGRYLGQVRRLGLQDHVVFLGRVPQRQMGALYRHCDLMVYPSLCESFGFSMIEGMGHGLPIVAADTAVNREMCGEAALYYPPLDPRAAAWAIAEAVSPDMSERLRRAGERRVASFDWSWRRYTREFVELVESVL